MLSQVLMLLTYVQGKVTLNLSQGTEYPDEGFLWFLPIPASEC